MAGDDQQQDLPRSIGRWLRFRRAGGFADLVAGLLVLGLVVIAFLYVADISNVDFIATWPPWAWAAVSIIIAVLFSWLMGKWRTLLVVGLAITMAILLSEESYFLLRGLWYDPASEIEQAADRGDLIKVVSLNCEKGSTGAIEDAFALDPDIILLRESPDLETLREIIPGGWEFEGWEDCAVLVRGEAYATGHPSRFESELYAVRSTPERIGQPITAIAVHLLLPPIWSDTWDYKAWMGAERLRRKRAETVEGALEQRDRYGDDEPVIIAGDFNAPSGHWLLQPLAAAGLQDAFAAVGTGWPNTIPSGYPLERVDFIWSSEELKPLRAKVVETSHSDHRMVVAELSLQ